MPPLPRLAAGFALAFLGATAALAAPAVDTRAAFLRLLDRPRVPLAATVQPAVAADGLSEQTFSYAADGRNRVPGLLLKSTTATPTAARRPVVINLHGTGGSKEGQRKLLQELARAGFIAVAIDGRHHGARTPGGETAKSAAYVEAIRRAWFEPGREYPFFYDTAWDVMRLIDWLVTRDDVDPRRLALWGLSKGGIEAYLAAAADPRVAAAVSCIGVQSFGWAADNDAWQSRIGTVQAAFDAAAQDRGVTKPDGAFVRAFYARVAPGIDSEFDGPAMLPLIAPRPFLAVNGETDARTPLPGLQRCSDAARAAYRAAGAEQNFTLIIQPATGHKVTSESMARIHAWLVTTLKP